METGCGARDVGGGVPGFLWVCELLEEEEQCGPSACMAPNAAVFQ